MLHATELWEQGMRCPVCGREYNDPSGCGVGVWLTKDHIYPKSHGGRLLQRMCMGCNQDKGALTPSVGLYRVLMALSYLQRNKGIVFQRLKEFTSMPGSSFMAPDMLRISFIAGDLVACIDKLDRVECHPYSGDGAERLEEIGREFLAALYRQIN